MRVSRNGKGVVPATLSAGLEPVLGVYDITLYVLGYSKVNVLSSGLAELEALRRLAKDWTGNCAF
jgi:hypothetical protein